MKITGGNQSWYERGHDWHHRILTLRRGGRATMLLGLPRRRCPFTENCFHILAGLVRGTLELEEAASSSRQASINQSFAPSDNSGGSAVSIAGPMCSQGRGTLAHLYSQVRACAEVLVFPAGMDAPYSFRDRNSHRARDRPACSSKKFVVFLNRGSCVVVS